MSARMKLCTFLISVTLIVTVNSDLTKSCDRDCLNEFEPVCVFDIDNQPKLFGNLCELANYECMVETKLRRGRMETCDPFL
ncbi:uncharacterized protein [Periplaneta americana]|uniref:uncharacterized protein n=1 Tax=Periplaneta americana TaxID=6978 RepID=UPI0037E97352